jgi:hypothetical protein
VKKLIIAAMVAAFGAAVVLPAAAIINPDGAFAAQKTAKKKKGKTKYFKRPQTPKKASPQTV